MYYRILIYYNSVQSPRGECGSVVLWKKSEIREYEQGGGVMVRTRRLAALSGTHGTHGTHVPG